MIRFLARLVLVLCALSAATDTAVARSYDVYSCGDGRNNAWTFYTDASATNVASGTTCPPRGGPYDGMHAFDAIGDGRQNTPLGRYAQWTFAAPAGTHIRSLSYQRNLGKEGDEDWSVFARTADAVLETCSLDFEPSCPRSGQITFPNLLTGRLTVGFSCQASVAPVCGNGSTRHRVWAAIRQSTVTLEDPSAPTLTPSGPLWSSGPHRGTVPMTLNTADNSGVLETRVFVDGRFQEQVVQPCDATYPVPCPPAAAVTHALDTTRFVNGSHRLEVLAYDSAGNPTGEERSVTFDNPVTRPVTGPGPSAPARVEAPAPSRSIGRRTARIRVTHAVRRGGRLLVAASLHRGARSPVTVTARTRGGTRRVRVRPERGRLSTTLVLQGRGPAVLTLAYPGDRTFGSQRVSRRV